MPDPRPGRGAGARGGRRHLRQRPEVLPRRRQVLGRREPARLGRDRGHPRPRVRGRGRAARRGGRPSAGASRSATGWSRSRSCRAGSAATACAGSTTCARRTTSTASSASRPGAMASYMVYPAEALVYRISKDVPRRTPPSPSRCRARCTRWSGPTSRSRTSSWSPAAGPSAWAWSRARRRRAQARSSPSTWPRHKLELAKKCGATQVINIAEEDRGRSSSRTLTDGYGADVYIEGTGHPAAVLQGLNLLRKLGTLRRVQRLRLRRHRRLVDHQRRQGARRPGGAPRPALLARGDPR